MNPTVPNPSGGRLATGASAPAGPSPSSLDRASHPAVRQLGLTTSQAAGYLGVSMSTIRRWCDLGHLKGYRTPGGQRRFSRDQLDTFVLSLADGQGTQRNG